MMKSNPIIDIYFNLEEAFKNDGFEISIKENSCVAYGCPSGNYGKVYIEFYQSFINNSPVDMKVIQYISKGFETIQETLFVGVAPTNQHDYEILMQLLFPSDDFKDKLELNQIDKYRIKTISKHNEIKTIST